ncbi:MAG TPA: SAM-dependent chlorinase/fluorinase [Dehalococcoidia bacterium]|nr:SAM-dependent chlorinase/fluorinase [Dehalococcoidia bacterium]
MTSTAGTSGPVQATEPPIITLTTDFGLRDGYVAAMKGVILSICRDARIVDVTHEIAPQAVAEAVFVTSTVWPFFPRDAIHVCVVDPGVGTERRALLLVTEHGRFIGPDNGVLSGALPDSLRARAPDGGGVVELTDDVRAFCLEAPAYQLPDVSRTFHGRDIFAPAAAHLAAGVPPERFGPRADRIVALPPFRARPDASGALRGRVIHVDRFGNLITDVRGTDLATSRVVVRIAGRTIRGLSPTFAAARGLLAFVGSYGYLAVAVRDGSAARELGVGVGAEVVVAPRDENDATG